MSGHQYLYLSVLLVLFIQEPAQSQRCSNADIGLWVDTSSSVFTAWRDPDGLQNFVREFILSLPIREDDTRLSAGIFADGAAVLWDLSAMYDRRDIADRVATMYFRNNNQTYIEEALKTARLRQFQADKGDRGDSPNIIVILTDGSIAFNATLVRQEASELIRNGYFIYVVAWGNVNETDLLTIAGGNRDNIYKAETYQTLVNDFQSIFKLICGEATTPAPERPNRSPGPVNPNAIVAPTDCTRADIAIMVDTSSSVSPDWRGSDGIQDFLKRFVQRLQIGRDLNRLSMTVFADGALVAWFLGSYFTQAQILSSIDGLYFRNATETQYGFPLNAARSLVFVPRNGDRQDAPNVAILVTDGTTLNRDEEAESIQTEVSALRNAFVNLYVVSWGNMDIDLATQITGNDGRVYYAPEAQDLNNNLDGVFSMICRTTGSAPPTARPPPPVQFPTATPLPPRVPTAAPPPPLQTQTPSPFPPQPPIILTPRSPFPQPGPVPSRLPRPMPDVSADVLFLVDSSGSIDVNDFGLMQDFIALLIQRILSTYNAQTALGQFSSEARVAWDFEDFNNLPLAQVTSQVYQLQNLGGATFKSSAFRLYLDELSAGKRGNRPNTQDIIIFVTDGQTVFEDRAVLYDVLPDALSQAIVIGVGIGPIDTSEMRRIVSPVFEVNYIPVDNFGGLNDAVPKVVAALQSNLDFSNEVPPVTQFPIITRQPQPPPISRGPQNTPAPVSVTRPPPPTQSTVSATTQAPTNSTESAPPTTPDRVTSTPETMSTQRLSDEPSSTIETRVTPTTPESTVTVSENVTFSTTSHTGTPGPPNPGSFPNEECQADILFLVDSSGSIRDAGENNYDLLKNFISNVILGLPIGENRVRVALAIFSGDTILQWDYNELLTAPELVGRVENLFYLGSTTFTSKAFELYVNRLRNDGGANPNVGNRADVRDIVILITDGNTTASDRPNLRAVLPRVKQSATVLGVGIGKVNLTEIESIVSSPMSQNYVGAENFAGLINVLDRVVSITGCPNDAFRTVPAPSPTEGPPVTQFPLPVITLAPATFSPITAPPVTPQPPPIFVPAPTLAPLPTLAPFTPSPPESDDSSLAVFTYAVDNTDGGPFNFPFAYVDDLSDKFNLANGELTIPVEGLYYFSMSAGAPANSTVDFTLFVENKEIDPKLIRTHSRGTGPDTISRDALLQLPQDTVVTMQSDGRLYSDAYKVTSLTAFSVSDTMKDPKYFFAYLEEGGRTNSTRISFPNIILNNQNDYDPATNQYRCPITAIYVFTFSVFVNPGDNVNAKLRVGFESYELVRNHTKHGDDGGDVLSRTVLALCYSNMTVGVELDNGAVKGGMDLTTGMMGFSYTVDNEKTRDAYWQLTTDEQFINDNDEIVDMPFTNQDLPGGDFAKQENGKFTSVRCPYSGWYYVHISASTQADYPLNLFITVNDIPQVAVFRASRWHNGGVDYISRSAIVQCREGYEMKVQMGPQTAIGKKFNSGREVRGTSFLGFMIYSDDEV